MKKKFYYGDKLVRTSETHNYTHAIIRSKADGAYTLIACASSYEKAVKRRENEISWRVRDYHSDRTELEITMKIVELTSGN